MVMRSTRARAIRRGTICDCGDVTTPRILVFQHIAIEHPGVFRDFLTEDGIAWTAVELDEGDTIPNLADFDALWVMGGPMDVWQDDLHPWLELERQAIREAVAVRRMPFLGFCLGHQLLAQALGGDVGPARTPEIGILGVELEPAGLADPLLRRLAPVHRTLQWHGAEVRGVPPETRILARSGACATQALGYGDHALSLQYHIEIGPETVSQWANVPAYKKALEESLGAGALPRLEAEAAAAMPEFNASARIVYDNFMNMVRNRLQAA